jgi:hypothetical protein
MPPGPLPQHCTLHLPLPRRAPPPTTAAGTNFAIRASTLAQVGWFPDYTVTEDYALGMELKMAGCRGAYLGEFLAQGEAPTEVRNVFRQRSRWTKGHMQVGAGGGGCLQEAATAAAAAICCCCCCWRWG